MLFDQVVQTSRAVAETRSRSSKIGLLAALVAQASPDELGALVGFLAGSPRQGRVGVGYALLKNLRVAAVSAPSLSVLDVDRALSELASCRGSGAATLRARTLGQLLARATGPEQDYLLRLLSGALRQGALDAIVAEGIASAARVPPESVRRAILLSGNLGLVARTALLEGQAGLARFKIDLFRPLEPMLAQTAEGPEEIIVDRGETAFEYKLDGARIQVHRGGNDVRVFTRALNDVTDAVPEIVEAARALPGESIVLDGEAIVLRPDGAPEPFQVTMRRFGRRLDVDRLRHELPISPFFFDCLHLDGQDTIDEAAEQRLLLLEPLLPASLKVPRIVTDDPEAARRFLRQALDAGHEGLVAKSLRAPYDAGRRGAAWRKIKPSHTLDLVVLAVEWGSGRRQGWLSNLHLGARDPATGGFVMVGKTFKGMTDAMLTWQTEKLLSLETHRDGHVVYVRPELVVEIAYDGVQKSPHYPGGIALRFARVKRYRTDKSAAEASTLGDAR